MTSTDRALEMTGWFYVGALVLLSLAHRMPIIMPLIFDRHLPPSSEPDGSRISGTKGKER